MRTSTANRQARNNFFGDMPEKTMQGVLYLAMKSSIQQYKEETPYKHLNKHGLLSALADSLRLHFFPHSYKSADTPKVVLYGLVTPHYRPNRSPFDIPALSVIICMESAYQNYLQANMAMPSSVELKALDACFLMCLASRSQPELLALLKNSSHFFTKDAHDAANIPDWVEPHDSDNFRNNTVYHPTPVASVASIALGFPVPSASYLASELCCDNVRPNFVGAWLGNGPFDGILRAHQTLILINTKCTKKEPMEDYQWHSELYKMGCMDQEARAGYVAAMIDSETCDSFLTSINKTSGGRASLFTSLCGNNTKAIDLLLATTKDERRTSLGERASEFLEPLMVAVGAKKVVYCFITTEGKVPQRLRKRADFAAIDIIEYSRNHQFLPPLGEK